MGTRAKKQAFELPKIKYIYTQPGKDRFTFYDVKFWPYSTPPCDEPIFAVISQREVIIGRLSAKTRCTVTILHHLTDPDVQGNRESLGLNSCAWAYIDPQRPLLIIAGALGLIKVIDVIKGQTVKPLIQHVNGNINDIAVHPLYPWIFATASEDGQIRIFDLRRCEVPRISPMIISCGSGTDGHRAGVLTVSWHETGRYLVTAGFDHQICVWTIPDLGIRSPFWQKIDPARVKRHFFETMWIYYPHFSTKALHSSYIDCVKFFGDLILSKAATENKIVLWKVTGFDSRKPPPPPMTAVKTAIYLDTRNGFMRTVVVDEDGAKRWEVPSEFRNTASYKRLLEFAAPYSDTFYLRFGLLLPSPAYPDLHPLITYGNAASELRFWDLEQILAGHAGERDGSDKRRGRKRKRPEAEVLPTREKRPKMEVPPVQEKTSKLKVLPAREKRSKIEANPPSKAQTRQRQVPRGASEKRSLRLQRQLPTVKLENVVIKCGSIQIKQGPAEIKEEARDARQESSDTIRPTLLTRAIEDVKFPAPSTLVGRSTSSGSDVVRPSSNTKVGKKESLVIPVKKLTRSKQISIQLGDIRIDRPVIPSMPLQGSTGPEPPLIPLPEMKYDDLFRFSSSKRSSTRPTPNAIRPTPNMSDSKTQPYSTRSRSSTRSKPYADQPTPNVSDSKALSSTVPVSSRPPSPSKSDGSRPSLDAPDGGSMSPMDSARRPPQLKTEAIQLSQDPPRIKRDENPVKRSARLTPHTTSPSPAATDIARDSDPVRKSARLTQRSLLPSPAASDDTDTARVSPLSASRAALQSPAASDTAIDSKGVKSSVLSTPHTPSLSPAGPDNSREATSARRSTRLKVKTKNRETKTRDAVRDTPPVEWPLASQSPVVLQPLCNPGVTTDSIRSQRVIPEPQIIVVHESSSESEEELSSALEMRQRSHNTRQLARETSESLDFDENILDSIEIGGEFFDAVGSERYRSTSLNTENTTSDTSESERVRSATLESEGTSDTSGKHRERSVIDPTEIDEESLDIEQKPPRPSTVPKSTISGISALSLQSPSPDLRRIVNSEKAGLMARDREKYPVDDPHNPLKAHMKILLDKLQFKNKAIWRILPNPDQWLGCFAVLYRTGLSDKHKSDDDFDQVMAMADKIRAILLELDDPEEVGARLKQLDVVLSQINEPKYSDDAVVQLQVMLTELLVAHPTVLEETLKELGEPLEELSEEFQETIGGPETSDEERYEDSDDGEEYEDAEESTGDEAPEDDEEFEDAEEDASDATSASDTEEVEDSNNSEARFYRAKLRSGRR
ncbi:WD domain-containing protein [Cladophialophora immunda]|nr:WD domain-containing protein [Cladophialophora immunda]